MAGDVNFGATPHLVHLADRYVIDTALDVLATLRGHDGLTTVGSLEVGFSDHGAMDIDPRSGIANAALQPAGQLESTLYAINLQSGAATVIGPIGGGILISSMAIEPPVRPVTELASTMLLSPAARYAHVSLERA